jgi:hypothetical protein
MAYICDDPKSYKGQTIGLTLCLAVTALSVLSCGRSEPAGAKPQASPSSSPSSSTCPSTVSVAQTLAAGVNGWESFEDDTPAQLMSVAVFDGHPRERASLVPDSDTESAGRRLVVWQLAENGTRHYWLACYYDHSRIALTRMLAGTVSRVEVTRDPEVTIGGQPEITGIAFK